MGLNFNCRKFFYIILCTFFILSCNSEKNRVKKVYDDRKEILNDFLNKTTVVGRNQNKLILFTYKNDSVNQYNIEKKATGFIITGKILQYEEDMSLNKINYTLNKMAALHIAGISCENRKIGVDLMIIMEPRKFSKKRTIIYYTNNFSDISSKEYREFLKSINEIDEHWYYSLKE